MSWKGVFSALAIMLLILAGYALLSKPVQVEAAPSEPEKFSFSMHMQESGIADNDYEKSSRAFVTVDYSASGVAGSEFILITLGQAPKTAIYEVTDYPSSTDKQALMKQIRTRLASYGAAPVGISLEDVSKKKDSVIIIPSDAMPDALASGGLLSLLENNVVIFFGKPLDIAIDQTASQKQYGNSVYASLNVTRDSSGMVQSASSGPKIRYFGNATIVPIGNGTLVLYDDLSEGSGEISDLVLTEAWQPVRKTATSWPTLSGNNTISIYSGSFENPGISIRLLYAVNSTNESKAGVIDLGVLEPGVNKLNVAELCSGDALNYSFELHDSLEYPSRYDMKIQFVKDGKVVDTQDAKTVIMKTFAADSGSVSPNVTAGIYTVRLIDQTGMVHAKAYTHIPQFSVKLVRIEGSDHIFLVTSDGKPVIGSQMHLTVNQKDNFTLQSDKNGEAGAAFMLSPGIHEFTIDYKGQKATVYYRASGDGNSILYLALLAGACLFAFVFFFKSRETRKWAIKTYHRPAVSSKTIRVPYDVLLRIFEMTQKSRAQGLPLNISDLRIGIRRFAVFKGSPVFLTDSNIYRIMDRMVKKGKFLSYSGYFLPENMSKGKPIEYWVLKRRIADWFIVRGEDMPKSKDADFVLRGRLIHLWQEFDPKKLATLCRKADNIIIFPDERRKDEFASKASAYDPNWMKVSLEMQYGRLRCQSIDEFLGRGSDGKV